MLLWCYLLWYLFVVVTYFDAKPTLWLSSVGLSLIVGTGLYLSTAHGNGERTRLSVWQVFRFYLMPFCVSSFSALIKGRGFVLIFHPSLEKNLEALGSCALFCAVVLACKNLGATAEKPADARFERV